jgi:hypothetical protein
MLGSELVGPSASSETSSTGTEEAVELSPKGLPQEGQKLGTFMEYSTLEPQFMQN